MIQVQDCRLDYNWIGRPEQEYPRYRVVRPEFDKALADFIEFVAAHELGKLAPSQWEVTYVNHMPRGTVWNTIDELAGLFRSTSGPTLVPEGLLLESLGAHWHYEIKPRRGRLHVELQHSLVGAEKKIDALVLKLTARGPIDKEMSMSKAIDEGLNLGHDVIVSSFAAMTSEAAHDFWNRENHDVNG